MILKSLFTCLFYNDYFIEKLIDKGILRLLRRIILMQNIVAEVVTAEIDGAVRRQTLNWSVTLA